MVPSIKVNVSKSQGHAQIITDHNFVQIEHIHNFVKIEHIEGVTNLT